MSAVRISHLIYMHSRRRRLGLVGRTFCLDFHRFVYVGKIINHISIAEDVLWCPPPIFPTSIHLRGGKTSIKLIFWVQSAD